MDDAVAWGELDQAPRRRRVRLVLATILIVAAAGVAVIVARTSSGPARKSCEDPVMARSIAGATVGLCDLPTGWREVTLAGQQGEDPCIIDPSHVSDRLDRDFVPIDGSGLNVGASIIVADSADTVSGAVRAVTNGTVISCFEAALPQAAAGSGSTVSELSVTTSTFDGGGVVEIRYRVQLDGQAHTGDVYQSLVVLGSGTRLSLIALSGGDRPFPPSLRDQLISAATHRLGR